MTANDERHGLHDREVALEDRVDHQLADARQGEDLLDDERAADEVGDVDAEHRDGRDDRVPQRVPDEHAALGEPLRARGRDVVRLEHLEQARAQAADQDRRDARARPSAPAGTSSAGGRRSRCRSRRPGTARPRCRPKTSSSMIPTQNGGKPRPTSGTARTTWSDERVALRRRERPRAAPRSAIESSVPKPISQSVDGQPSSTSCPAGTL